MASRKAVDLPAKFILFFMRPKSVEPSSSSSPESKKHVLMPVSQQMDTVVAKPKQVEKEKSYSRSSSKIRSKSSKASHGSPLASAELKVEPIKSDRETFFTSDNPNTLPTILESTSSTHSQALMQVIHSMDNVTPKAGLFQSAQIMDTVEPDSQLQGLNNSKQQKVNTLSKSSDKVYQKTRSQLQELSFSMRTSPKSVSGPAPIPNDRDSIDMHEASSDARLGPRSSMSGPELSDQNHSMDREQMMANVTPQANRMQIANTSQLVTSSSYYESDDDDDEVSETSDPRMFVDFGGIFH